MEHHTHAVVTPGLTGKHSLKEPHWVPRCMVYLLFVAVFAAGYIPNSVGIGLWHVLALTAGALVVGTILLGPRWKALHPSPPAIEPDGILIRRRLVRWEQVRKIHVGLFSHHVNLQASDSNNTEWWIHLGALNGRCRSALGALDVHRPDLGIQQALGRWAAPRTAPAWPRWGIIMAALAVNLLLVFLVLNPWRFPESLLPGNGRPMNIAQALSIAMMIAPVLSAILLLGLDNATTDFLRGIILSSLLVGAASLVHEASEAPRWPLFALAAGSLAGSALCLLLGLVRPRIGGAAAVVIFLAVAAVGATVALRVNAWAMGGTDLTSHFPLRSEGVVRSADSREIIAGKGVGPSSIYRLDCGDKVPGHSLEGPWEVLHLSSQKLVYLSAPTGRGLILGVLERNSSSPARQMQIDVAAGKVRISPDGAHAVWFGWMQAQAADGEPGDDASATQPAADGRVEAVYMAALDKPQLEATGAPLPEPAEAEPPFQWKSLHWLDAERAAALGLPMPPRPSPNEGEIVASGSAPDTPPPPPPPGDIASDDGTMTPSEAPPNSAQETDGPSRPDGRPLLRCILHVDGSEPEFRPSRRRCAVWKPSPDARRVFADPESNYIWDVIYFALDEAEEVTELPQGEIPQWDYTSRFGYRLTRRDHDIFLARFDVNTRREELAWRVPSSNLQFLGGSPSGRFALFQQHGWLRSKLCLLVDLTTGRTLTLRLPGRCRGLGRDSWSQDESSLILTSLSRYAERERKTQLTIPESWRRSPGATIACGK